MKDKITLIRNQLIEKLTGMGFECPDAHSHMTIYQRLEIFKDGQQVAKVRFSQKYSWSDVTIVVKHAGIEPRDWVARKYWTQRPMNPLNWGSRNYRKVTSAANAIEKFMAMVPDANEQKAAKLRAKVSKAYKTMSDQRKFMKACLDTEAVIELLEKLDADFVSTLTAGARESIHSGQCQLAEYYELKRKYEELRDKEAAQS